MDIIDTILKSNGFEDIKDIRDLLGPHEAHRDRSDMYQSAYNLSIWRMRDQRRRLSLGSMRALPMENGRRGGRFFVCCW